MRTGSLCRTNGQGSTGSPDSAIARTAANSVRSTGVGTLPNPRICTTPGVIKMDRRQFILNRQNMYPGKRGRSIVLVLLVLTLRCHRWTGRYSSNPPIRSAMEVFFSKLDRTRTANQCSSIRVTCFDRINKTLPGRLPPLLVPLLIGSNLRSNVHGQPVASDRRERNYLLKTVIHMSHVLSTKNVEDRELCVYEYTFRRKCCVCGSSAHCARNPSDTVDYAAPGRAAKTQASLLSGERLSATNTFRHGKDRHQATAADRRVVLPPVNRMRSGQ